MGAFLWVFAPLAAFLYIRWKRNQSKLPLPPGPKKLPFIGNLLDIPAKRPWEAFYRWSKEFHSDVIYLNVAGTSIVVLSSVEATQELLEKRSSLYSDRPYSPMATDLMGWDWALPIMKYGEKWREQRRLFHGVFNVEAVKQFHPQQRTAIYGFLQRVLDSAQDPMSHLRHLVGVLIMDLTYGIKVLPTNDPYVSTAEDAINGLSMATVPGRFLVDTIHALKYVPSWMPGAGFKRQAREWKKVTLKMLEQPFLETKRTMSLETFSPSFTSSSLQNIADGELLPAEKEAKESVVKATAAVMYAGAADTTVSALGTFILAMLSHPEVQEKGQAEIDTVLRGNLPDFRNKDELPYVMAIMREVLRWKPITSLGFPHCVLVEDKYNGHRIPAGSLVFGNVWAILQDEEMYPDPFSFKPERFLLNGELNPTIRDPASVVFGFGRRICPGKHLAADTMWLAVASILATVNIKKKLGENGNVMEPSYEYFEGIISHPLPFECSITPRSPQAAEAIQRGWE